MIVIYVIGFPVFAFTILFLNRNKLNKPEVLRYILLLYQGLKHETYYWEIVNTIRKSTLILLHVFITNDHKVMKALLGSFIMFTCSILQGRLRPYKIEVISDLEHREMISSILVLYGGLIFVQENSELEFLQIVIFIIIIIMNLRFWLLWGF